MSTYQSTFNLRRLWAILIGGLTIMFATLLYFGNQIYREAPPIPALFVTAQGTAVFSRSEIEHGQRGWQSIVEMQQGSIWGHGS